MNPENPPKKIKFLCRCCAKQEEFNSDDVIFDYFGRDFTEYEYVIENLAIRPAPKKLLDLVPVHSTNISKTTIDRISTITDNPSEPLQQASVMQSPTVNQLATGEGDFRNTNKGSILKVRDGNDDFISFRGITEEKRLAKPNNPYSSYPDDLRTIKDITELRQTIRSKEYRTPKQILSDLCEASEQCLTFKKEPAIEINRPMPSEIKDTIDTLRFKKPMPQFFTRTEKRLFHTPGVYFAEVKTDFQSGEKKSVQPPSKGSIKNQKQRESDSSTIDILVPNYDSQSKESHYYGVDCMAQTEVNFKRMPMSQKRQEKSQMENYY